MKNYSWNIKFILVQFPYVYSVRWTNSSLRGKDGEPDSIRICGSLGCVYFFFFLNTIVPLSLPQSCHTFETPLTFTPILPQVPSLLLFAIPVILVLPNCQQYKRSFGTMHTHAAWAANLRGTDNCWAHNGITQWEKIRSSFFLPSHQFSLSS